MFDNGDALSVHGWREKNTRETCMVPYQIQEQIKKFEELIYKKILIIKEINYWKIQLVTIFLKQPINFVKSTTSLILKLINIFLDDEVIILPLLTKQIKFVILIDICKVFCPK